MICSSPFPAFSKADTIDVVAKRVLATCVSIGNGPDGEGVKHVPVKFIEGADVIEGVKAFK